MCVYELMTLFYHGLTHNENKNVPNRIKYVSRYESCDTSVGNRCVS